MTLPKGQGVNVGKFFDFRTACFDDVLLFENRREWSQSFPNSHFFHEVLRFGVLEMKRF